MAGLDVLSKEDDPNIVIKAPALDATRITSYFAAAVAIGTPILAWVTGQEEPVRAAALSIMLVAVPSIAFFGLLGYVLVKLGCEPAPLLLGFVLGPLLEQHLRRALIISQGDPSVFVTRPISLVLLIAAVLALGLAVLPSIRKKREVVFQEEDPV